MAELRDDLKTIVSNKILSEVIEKRPTSSHKTKLQWKVLILDDVTLRMVSTCLTMSQLAAEGVSSVEHVHKHREANSLAEGIFFMSPTKKNVTALLDDIKHKFYRSFRIMFTETCPNSILSSLFSKVGPTNLIKGCKEVYLSFIPIEKHVFSLSMKPILKPSLTDDEGSQGITNYCSNLMEQMAEKLATLCVTLGGQPSLCFQKKCKYTGQFANLVNDKIKTIKEAEGEVSGSGSSSADSKVNQYQVLILDRGFDLISCLVHDMYYQAVSYDILGGDKIEVDKQAYTYLDDGQQKVHQLEDTDSIWEELKHKHIADVFEILPEMLRKEKRKEDDRKNEGTKTDMKQLKKDVQGLTKDRKRRKELSIHTGITDNLNVKIEHKKIAPDLCEVEQGLATGGRMSKLFTGGTMQEKFLRLIMDREIDQADKIRLLCLYIFYENGIPEQKLKSYMSNAQITDQVHHDIFKNLSHYGYSFTAGVETNTEQLSVPLQNKTHRRNAPHSSSQQVGTSWVPVLKDLIGW